MTKIKVEKWKINLPVFPPGEDSDNSTRQTYIDCPRLGLYRYGMRRGFEGKNWPIQYGLAYHKYREKVEDLMRAEESPMTDEIHLKGIAFATEDWEDPPFDHKKSFLDLPRLLQACELAKRRIELEQKNKTIIVTRSEDSFDLELPFRVCRSCGFAFLSEEATENCERCNSETYRARHGGRIDQFVEKLGSLYIRDFKTTGFMGPYYGRKFDPNAQIQGYVWAGTQLAGRPFNGALVETVYNTKTKGPEISQLFVDFTQGQMEQWIVSQMMHHQMIMSCWARVEELGYLAFPQNTANCTNYGTCRFIEPCQMSSGREIDKWLESYTIYSHWDYANPDEEESQV